MKFAILIFIICSKNSWAGLWLEPYLGVGVGNQKYTESNYAGSNSGRNGEYDLKFSGLRYGMKARFSLPLVATGFVFEGGSVDHSASGSTVPNNQNQSEKDEFGVRNFGVFGTFHALPIVNLTATFFLTSRWKDQNGADADERYKGSGFGAGMAFKFFPLINLFLDYRLFTFNEYENSAGDKELPSSNSTKHEISEVVLGVSLPVDI